MKGIRLADNLVLPPEAGTQTFLIVGKRGSGKTSTAVRLAEELHRVGIPFAVVDCVDVWWGLKASRDGGRGLGVYVFGGRHGDLPLESTAGALMADVVVEHPLSRELLAEQLEIHPNGGRFGSDLARLRTMGIITARGPIAPTEALYR